MRLSHCMGVFVALLFMFYMCTRPGIETLTWGQGTKNDGGLSTKNDAGRTTARRVLVCTRDGANYPADVNASLYNMSRCLRVRGRGT